MERKYRVAVDQSRHPSRRYMFLRLAGQFPNQHSHREVEYDLHQGLILECLVREQNTEDRAGQPHPCLGFRIRRWQKQQAAHS